MPHANTNDTDLALRDGTSLLLLRNGIDAILLDESTVNVGSSISGGTFSRGRWRKLVEEEERQIQAARDERERERARKIEAKRKAKADADAAIEAAATARRNKVIADLQASAEQIPAQVLRHLVAPGSFAVPALPRARPVARTVERKPDPEPDWRGIPDNLRKALLKRAGQLLKSKQDIPQHQIDAAKQLQKTLRNASFAPTDLQNMKMLITELVGRQQDLRKAAARELQL